MTTPPITAHHQMNVLGYCEFIPLHIKCSSLVLFFNFGHLYALARAMQLPGRLRARDTLVSVEKQPTRLKQRLF